MKTLYLDIFSGISGDMFVGAMIDLGADFKIIERELAKLSLDGYHLRMARQEKSGIAGVKFDVHLEQEKPRGSRAKARKQEHAHAHEHTHADGTTHSHPHSHEQPHDHEHEHAHGRTFGEIRQMIEDSALSDWVKQKSVAVFQRIAVAEGKIHGMPPERVHFHEVGAVDSIVDIVGACVALEQLGKPRVLASAVVEGTGFVQCAHGRLPLPAPATLEILGARGVAVTQCDEPHELVTPTGAALLAEFAASFGPMQGLKPAKIGYGLGARDNRTRPNVLRAVLGSEAKVAGPKAKLEGAGAAEPDWETDTVAVLETNLDDVTAELLGHFVERAFAAGALDVFHTPIQMKKNRPGVLLTVLCASGDADRFAELMLRETTAFGVRQTIAERRKLQRELITVKTPFGDVTVKLGKLNGQIVQSAPEFESCRQAAERAGVSLKQVYEAAHRAARAETL